MTISQQELISLLHYDPVKGIFIWRKRPRNHFTTNRSHTIWNVKNAEKQAGWTDEKGYIRIRVLGKVYKAHRLAFLYTHGWLPEEVDHINANGPKSDNRISNLRAATGAQNKRNVGLRRDNSYGIKGVSYHKTWRKWYAEIQVDGIRHYLGQFNTQEEAARVYEEAVKEYHKEFGRIK